MKKVIFALAAAFVFFNYGYAQSPALEWELVNPFRFITDRTAIDELRTTYAGLAVKNAGNLERALQNAADDNTKKIRAEARKKYDCDKDVTAEARKKCFAPYSGWVAWRLVSDDAANRYPGTCWDQKNKEYRTDGLCADYIHPKSHKIRVWISNSGLDGQTVQWFINSAPLDTKKCSPQSSKEHCVEFDLNYSGKNDEDDPAAAPEISAKLANGTVIVSKPIRVNDRLFVGLGDSYASGEGNPDRPASFTKGRTDVDFLYDLKVRRNPQKDKDGEAVWLDQRCHRSMYSYQFKTALQYALEYPREAVTFVSFSCSGAVTDDIISHRQKPKEGSPRLEPQLKALQNTMDKGGGTRAIDYLLLSTGGNDIKFARFVSYVVNTGLIKWIYAKKPDKKTAGKIRETLLFDKKEEPAGNYFKLQEALFEGKNKVLIRNCHKNIPCDRILLTGYPNPFQNGTDGKELCRADRWEFDVPFKKDSDRARRIIKIRDLMFDPLRKVQEDPAISKTLGWTLVKGHFDDYLLHGFCAQGKSGESGNGEIFVMPKREHKKWIEFDPWEYRVYESRQRWIKIPVDSKLSTDQTHIIRVLSIDLDLFFEDDRANIMHPTAEGLSRTADANFAEVERLKGQP